MAEPHSFEWRDDWIKLTLAERDDLECRYDGPIPHESILDALRNRPMKWTAVPVDPLIAEALRLHGIVPKEESSS